MNLPIKIIQDENGSNFAPVTVPSAVRWENGDDLNDKLGGKQDTISDLNAIRSGASAGATAVQPATLMFLNIMNNI